MSAPALIATAIQIAFAWLVRRRFWHDENARRACRSENVSDDCFRPIADLRLISQLTAMGGSKNYNSLMHEVCVELGWCGGIVDGKPSHVDDFIPATGIVSAAQFADWLFLADGVDPSENHEKWQKHKDELVAAFIRHMSADSVEASRLKWDLD